MSYPVFVDDCPLDLIGGRPHIFDRCIQVQKCVSYLHTSSSTTTMNRNSFVFLLVAAVLLCVDVSGRKERDVPHGHYGVIKPHNPGPFDVTLKESDEKELSSGKSVMKQVMPKPGDDDSAGGVFCVQDIEAPKDAVWNQILGMDDYVKKVSKVLECKNYQVQKNEDGSITIKTRQKLGVLPGYSVRTEVHFDSDR